jgi:hypothetical protein
MDALCFYCEEPTAGWCVKITEDDNEESHIFCGTCMSDYLYDMIPSIVGHNVKTIITVDQI